MPSLQETRQGMPRRKFLQRSGQLLLINAASPLLSGCNLLLPQEREVSRWKEKEPGPLDGNLVVVSGEHWLLRNDKRYHIERAELVTYLRNRKFERYGGKLFYLPQGSVDHIPEGERSRLPTVADPYTTEPKNNPLGGEMNVFIPGLLTDEGDLWELMKPREDTFISLLSALEGKGWNPLTDSFFFRYGEDTDEHGGYDARLTAKDPRENIAAALTFFQALKEKFPLAQFNLYAHSLAGVFAMAIAKQHYDAINNVVLLNAPVNGIEETIQRRILVESALRAALWLEGIILEERVSRYLFDLWNNKQHRRELEDFAEFFRGRLGRGLTSIIDESDPVVPVESASVKGAREIHIATGKKPSIQDLVRDWRSYPVAHGRPLKDEGVRHYILEQVGENLAAA